MCVTVEPLPFVPPTVITGQEGLSMRRARATAETRANPRSIVLGWTDSCRASHSSKVRTREVGRSGRLSGRHLRQLQQYPQDTGDPVTHVTAIDDHVQRTVLQQELASLEAFRKGLAHGLLNDAWSGETDQGARLCNV